MLNKGSVTASYYDQGDTTLVVAYGTTWELKTRAGLDTIVTERAPEFIYAIAKNGNELYLGTYGGLYKAKHGVTGYTYEKYHAHITNQVIISGDRVISGTEDGRLFSQGTIGDRDTRVVDYKSTIIDINQSGDNLWILTAKAIFCNQALTLERLDIEDVPLHLSACNNRACITYKDHLQVITAQTRDKPLYSEEPITIKPQGYFKGNLDIAKAYLLSQTELLIQTDDELCINYNLENKLAKLDPFFTTPGTIIASNAGHFLLLPCHLLKYPLTTSKVLGKDL